MTTFISTRDTRDTPEKRASMLAEAEKCVRQFIATGGGDYKRFAAIIKKSRRLAQSWYNLGMASYETKSLFLTNKLTILDVPPVPFPNERDRGERRSGRATRVRDIMQQAGRPMLLSEIVDEYNRVWKKTTTKAIFTTVHQAIRADTAITRTPGNTIFEDRYSYTPVARTEPRGYAKPAVPLPKQLQHELREKTRQSNTIMAKVLVVLLDNVHFNTSHQMTTGEIADEVARRHDLPLSDRQVFGAICSLRLVEHGGFVIHSGGRKFWMTQGLAALRTI